MIIIDIEFFIALIINFQNVFVGTLWNQAGIIVIVIVIGDLVIKRTIMTLIDDPACYLVFCLSFCDSMCILYLSIISIWCRCDSVSNPQHYVGQSCETYRVNTKDMSTNTILSTTVRVSIVYLYTHNYIFNYWKVLGMYNIHVHVHTSSHACKHFDCMAHAWISLCYI